MLVWRIKRMTPKWGFSMVMLLLFIAVGLVQVMRALFALLVLLLPPVLSKFQRLLRHPEEFDVSLGC